MDIHPRIGRLTRWILIVLGLALLAGCPAPAAPPAVSEAMATPPAADEATVTPPAADEATVTPPAASEAPAAEKSQIRLLMAQPGQDSFEFALLENQIARFHEQFPWIQVDLELVPFSNLAMKLAVSVASGDAPDVVAVPAAGSIEALAAGYSLPARVEEGGPFLPEALFNVQFGDQYAGTPWRRFGDCSPYYTALILPIYGRHEDEAQILVDFLTSAEEQKTTYEASSGLLLPTLIDLYSALGLECPERGIVLQPAPTEQARIQSIVLERAPLLETVLKENNAALQSLDLLPPDPPQFFNPDQATGAIGLESDRVTDGYQNFEIPGMLLAAMAPIGLDYSRDAFSKALLQESGVIVGAYFGVDAPLLLRFDEGEVEIQPGETLAVKWRAVDDSLQQVAVFLVEPDRNEREVGILALHEIRSERAEQMGSGPSVTVEVVNPCRIYYKVDERVTYTSVARISLGSTMWWLTNVDGATILYHACDD